MSSVFAKIRSALGGGSGVGITLELPQEVSRGDATVTVTVTLEGHKSRVTIIEDLHFVFLGDDGALRSHSETGGYLISQQAGHEVAVELSLSLPAGETRAITTDIPLPYAEIAADDLVSQTHDTHTVGDERLSHLLEKAAGRPQDLTHYQVTVTARAQHARNLASASRTIRLAQK